MDARDRPDDRRPGGYGGLAGLSEGPAGLKPGPNWAAVQVSRVFLCYLGCGSVYSGKQIQPHNALKQYHSRHRRKDFKEQRENSANHTTN